jgi:hypothetical protein
VKAKKAARKQLDPQPLLKLYKISNTFPQAVAKQRAKMRLLLDGLGTWWEEPRIFGVSATNHAAFFRRGGARGRRAGAGAGAGRG